MATDDRDVSDNNKDAANVPAASVTPAPEAPLSRKGASRRRFAKASAGATGVLLTLHSQPGMACTFCGVSPSLIVSSVAQHRAVTQLSNRPKSSRCAGLSPAQWKDKKNWPCNQDATFGNFFTCRGIANTYGGEKIRDIICGAKCDNFEMAKYFMAAYMNINAGLIDFMTAETLETVWNQWTLKGYYEPMPGQQWGTSEILYYLRGTMD